MNASDIDRIRHAAESDALHCAGDGDLRWTNDDMLTVLRSLDAKIAEVEKDREAWQKIAAHAANKIDALTAERDEARARSCGMEEWRNSAQRREREAEERSKAALAQSVAGSAAIAEVSALRAKLTEVEAERDGLKGGIDPENAAWFNRMLDECERDVWTGLDHSLSNAPGRIAVAKQAFDRLVRTTKRFAHLAHCPDTDALVAAAQGDKVGPSEYATEMTRWSEALRNTVKRGQEAERDRDYFRAVVDRILKVHFEATGETQTHDLAMLPERIGSLLAYRKALIAMAYEAAADSLGDRPEHAYSAWRSATERIRALTPADAKAALDAMLERARGEGRRAEHTLAVEAATQLGNERLAIIKAQWSADMEKARAEEKDACVVDVAAEGSRDYQSMIAIGEPAESIAAMHIEHFFKGWKAAAESIVARIRARGGAK